MTTNIQIEDRGKTNLHLANKATFLHQMRVNLDSSYILMSSKTCYRFCQNILHFVDTSRKYATWADFDRKSFENLLFWNLLS